MKTYAGPHILWLWLANHNLQDGLCRISSQEMASFMFELHLETHVSSTGKVNASSASMADQEGNVLHHCRYVAALQLSFWGLLHQA